MFLMLIAAAVSIQPAAAEQVQYRSHDISGALQRGCTVQRVHVGGGKAEHAPIIRCPANTTEVKDVRRTSAGA